MKAAAQSKKPFSILLSCIQLILKCGCIAKSSLVQSFLSFPLTTFQTPIEYIHVTLIMDSKLVSSGAIAIHSLS